MAHVCAFGLAGLVVASIASACGPADRPHPRETETGAAAPAAAGPAAERRVSNVMIGSRIGQSNRIIQPTAEFTPRDTVHLSVAVSGASGADRVTAAWRSQSGEVVKQSSDAIGASGENTAFHLAGLKPGVYKVIVFLGDDSVATKVFRVVK